MSVSIDRISPSRMQELISQKIAPTMDEDGLVKFQQAMAFTTIMWSGSANGSIKCLWGLVPPTLLAEEAYLWLHVIEPVGDYEFAFVRHSQVAIEEALKLFPVIRGHCEAGADRSMRWIKWLGGKFYEPEGRMVPFVIRRP